MSFFALCDYLLINKLDFYYSTMYMYCLGYYVSSVSLKIKTVAIGISIVVIIIIVSLPSFHYNILFESKVGYACGLHDCMTVFMVLGCIIIFIKLDIQKVYALIYWISKYSFSVYLVHGLYCTGSPISVFKYINHLPLAIIIFSLLTFSSALILNKITDRISHQYNR